MRDNNAVIDAIAEEVWTRIPTLEEFAALGDPGDLGPDVTIPAIWMSLLLTRIRGLKATLKIRELEARGSLPQRGPPLSDEETGDYAGALANHAFSATGDAVAAASVLFQGGVAAMMTTLPADAVIATLDNVVDIFDLRAILGVEATKQ